MLGLAMNVGVTTAHFMPQEPQFFIGCRLRAPALVSVLLNRVDSLGFVLEM
jgi:hypothetical protein